MNASFSLAPVVQYDIVLLGRIFAEAFNEDLLRWFIFIHGPDLDLSVRNSTIGYKKEIAKPPTQFIKA